MWENGLIRKLRLDLKFMTPQTGKQIVTIYILLNITTGKGNQAINFGQLIEYNVKNIFLQNHAENKAFRPLFVFQKSFI